MTKFCMERRERTLLSRKKSSEVEVGYCCSGFANSWIGWILYFRNYVGVMKWPWGIGCPLMLAGQSQ